MKKIKLKELLGNKLKTKRRKGQDRTLNKTQLNGETHKVVKEKNPHMSACAATALPSLKVGILREHLVPTGRVDIHLLLCLHIM